MIEKSVIGYSRPAEEVGRVLVICGTHGDETGAILNIYAPCRLMVQDICCPDVAFEGYPILEYSPLD